MRDRREPCSVVAALLFLAVSPPATTLAQTPQGTAFTYQGQLSEGGSPADGTYDFQLILYDAAVGGNQVGPIVTIDDVAVTQGLFTVSLDFGAVFSGSRRWLELGVRPGAGSGGYVPVLPRHELSPTPSAAFSAETPWPGVSGKPPGFADDVDNDTTYDAGEGLDLAGTVFSIADGGVTTPKLAADAVTSAQIADGTIALADLGQNGCAGSQVMKWNGAAWACAADDDSGGTVTSLTAGSGLTGGTITTTGTVAVDFGGTGGATTVARSDHDHLGDTWSGPTGTSPGLRVVSATAHGIVGWATAASGFAYGVYGQSESSIGRAVYGVAPADSGPTFGIEGAVLSDSGTAVRGLAYAVSGNATGAWGTSQSSEGVGVRGEAISTGGATYGVLGYAQSTGGRGVYGFAGATSGLNYGIHGRTNSSAGYAGYFEGRVHVTGVLSKGGGSFKIDHPLDPENKYLYHSFVESPDMKNVYDGLVTTDPDGYASVELPEWFGALNRDFRYQLTVLDEGDSPGFVQAKVVRKVAGNRFAIRTSAPGVEVSWQVTGIRKDPFAEAHRIPVEEDKPDAERGTYLHPGAWGQPVEKGLDEARRPEEPPPHRFDARAEEP